MVKVFSSELNAMEYLTTLIWILVILHSKNSSDVSTIIATLITDNNTNDDGSLFQGRILENPVFGPYK